MARDEAVRAVQVAVSSLPDGQREAVRLRYQEGKPTKAVAEAMQRSEPAVRGLLDRAKERMREILGSASAYFSRR